MDALNSLMHVAFYGLLILSGITIILLVVFVAARAIAKKEFSTPRVIATWTGIFTSVGTFAIAILNFTFPIGVLPEKDFGAIAIKTYYESIQNQKCDQAWALIHNARKKQLQDDYQFGRDQFCDAYKTTQTYRNLKVVREDNKLDQISSRIYRVAYDVEDVFPRNNLYDLQLKDFVDVVRSGPYDEKVLTGLIVENLRLYYIVPDETISMITELVAKTPFWFVAAPEFVAEVKRLLKIKYKIVLEVQKTAPPNRPVFRHYVHSITMMLDDRKWKIRDGLARPLLVAPYVPRDKIL